VNIPKDMQKKVNKRTESYCETWWVNHHSFQHFIGVEAQTKHGCDDNVE